MDLTYDDLIRVANKAGDAELTTAGGRAKFKVVVIAGVLYAIPVSTGKARELGSGSKKAIERYNVTGSLKTSHYHDLTLNASYVLAVIALAR